MTKLKTLDTDFAAAMMSKGARLDCWEKSSDGRKLYWQVANINPDWITEYQQGKDGLTKFVNCRRMLISIAKSEIQNNERK